MTRIFMIVKPKICCKDASSIGDVGVYIEKSDHPMTVCQCGARYQSKPDTITVRFSDGVSQIQESRIIWLPDESDVINHDMKLDIPLKV